MVLIVLAQRVWGPVIIEDGKGCRCIHCLFSVFSGVWNQRDVILENQSVAHWLFYAVYFSISGSMASVPGRLFQSLGHAQQLNTTTPSLPPNYPLKLSAAYASMTYFSMLSVNHVASNSVSQTSCCLTHLHLANPFTTYPPDSSLRELST